MRGIANVSSIYINLNFDMTTIFQPRFVTAKTALSPRGWGPSLVMESVVMTCAHLMTWMSKNAKRLVCSRGHSTASPLTTLGTPDHASFTLVHGKFALHASSKIQRQNFLREDFALTLAAAQTVYYEIQSCKLDADAGNTDDGRMLR